MATKSHLVRDARSQFSPCSNSARHEGVPQSTGSLGVSIAKVRLEIWPVVSLCLSHPAPPSQLTLWYHLRGSVAISTQLWALWWFSSSLPRDAGIRPFAAPPSTRSRPFCPQFSSFSLLSQGLPQRLPTTSFLTPDPPDPSLSPFVVPVFARDKPGPPLDPEVLHQANQISSHSGMNSMRMEQPRPRLRPVTQLWGAALSVLYWSGRERPGRRAFPFLCLMETSDTILFPKRRSCHVKSQSLSGSCIDDSLLPLVSNAAGVYVANLKIARSYHGRSEDDLSHVHLLALGYGETHPQRVVSRTWRVAGYVVGSTHNRQ